MTAADRPSKHDDITTSCLDSLADLALTEWASEHTSFFLGFDWFALLARHIVTEQQAQHVWIAESADGSKVLLPTMTTPTSGARAMVGLSNYYSSLFGPAWTPGDAPFPGMLDRLLDAINATRPRWQQLRLDPLDRQAESTSAIQMGLRARGWWVQPFFCFGNWYLRSTDLDWESYLQSRPSQVRNTLKRKQKKFDKDPANRLSLYNGDEGLETAIAAYQSVYGKSWKQAEPYPLFIADLIRLCARRGWLRLGVAWVGDTPIAAQLWVVAHGKAAIFKLAYDEEYKPLSAGTLLTAMLMRHVLEVDRVTEVDYLTGEDAYKRDWMSERRERWGLLACNPRTIGGFVSGVRHIGAAWLKALTRRLAGRSGQV